MLLSPELADVAMVSISWVFLYLTFTCSVSATKLSPETQSKPPDSQLHWNLRVQGNMLEQSVPFLASLALHAVLVDATKAAQLGWLWLLSRAIYPFVFAKGPPLLFVSTLPGYGFIGALLWPVGALAFA